MQIRVIKNKCSNLITPSKLNYYALLENNKKNFDNYNRKSR